jgi:hypothetical protein
MADILVQKIGTNFEFTLDGLKRLLTGGGKKHFYAFIRNGKSSSSGLDVRVAPAPTDIVWEHQGFPLSSIICRRIVTFATTFFLLGVCFGLVLALKVAQREMKKSEPTNGELTSNLKYKLISVVITICINLVNYLFGLSLRKLTLTEKHDSHTSFHQSLTIKMVLVSPL